MTRGMFTLIRYCHEPTRGEFVNVGLIFKTDEPPLIISRFSQTRIQRIARLYPSVDDALIKMVKRGIEKAIAPLKKEHEMHKGEPLLGDAFQLDSRRIRLLDPGYLEYLSSYHNGLIQFTRPQPVVTDNPEKEVERIYNMFVADPEELEKKSQRELPSTVYHRLRDELKPVANRVDFDYELRRESVQGLLVGTTLDFIGYNGQLVCGKSFDPETQGIDTAYRNLAILVQVFDALRMNYSKDKKEGIYYVVTKRPDPNEKKLHHLWESLMYWSTKNVFRVADASKVSEIREYVEQQNVLPFSQWVREHA